MTSLFMMINSEILKRVKWIQAEERSVTLSGPRQTHFTKCCSAVQGHNYSDKTLVFSVADQ